MSSATDGNETSSSRKGVPCVRNESEKEADNLRRDIGMSAERTEKHRE